MIKKRYPKYNFIFIGNTESEEDIFLDFEKKLNFKVYSIIKEVSIFELALVFKDGGFFIGVDSGPANISYLTKIRSITIAGPGPHLFLPYRKNKLFVDVSGGRNFLQRFFYGKNKIINKISTKSVFDIFEKSIKK
jgi:ADP-heptose:LPS heptosyltransferase